MRSLPLKMLTLVSAAALAGALSACGDNRGGKPAQPALKVAEAETAQPQPEAAPPADAAPAETAAPATDDWRKVVSNTDEGLLGRLDDAWRLARIEAEEDGYSAQVEKLGPLGDPNAARVGRSQPGPGSYRCRTIKMGTRDGGTLAYVDYPFFACRVELTPGGDLILTKTTGSQRFQGRLYPDADSRLVYVGTQAWGDERGFPAYGAQPERDQAGVVERIGENRWRVVIPWPKQESKLDLIEIVR